MSGNSRTSAPLPLKLRLLIAAHSFAQDTARRSNMTINRSLQNVFDPKAPPSATPINGVSSFDTMIDPSRNIWFRLYAPSSATSGMPLIVYFHGGGFCFMSASSKNFDQLCRRLAREIHAVIISVNYRLAPEHKYPCQFEDGFDALKFIDENNLSNVEVDLARCFIGGDSAGGNLAHHMVLKACEHSFRNLRVIGLISIQPFFGGEERTESETKLTGRVPIISVERTDWMWKAFLPEGFDRNHPAVNIFGMAMDSAVKFPATLLFIGGFDILKDWQKRYYEWLSKAGKVVHLVEYPNAIHGFYCLPELPELSLMITEVREFIKNQSAYA